MYVYNYTEFGKPYTIKGTDFHHIFRLACWDLENEVARKNQHIVIDHRVYDKYHIELYKRIYKPFNPRFQIFGH